MREQAIAPPLRLAAGRGLAVPSNDSLGGGCSAGSRPETRRRRQQLRQRRWRGQLRFEKRRAPQPRASRGELCAAVPLFALPSFCSSCNGRGRQRPRGSASAAGDAPLPRLRRRVINALRTEPEEPGLAVPRGFRGAAGPPVLKTGAPQQPIRSFHFGRPTGSQPKACLPSEQISGA